MRIVIWGYGFWGKTFYNAIDKQKISVVAIVDNDPEKWGGESVKIISSEKLIELEYDYIYICIEDYNSVREQCISMGINEDKLCVGAPTDKKYDIFYEILKPSYKISLVKNEIEESLKRYELQNYWRNVFIDTIKGYEWWNNSSLSLGRFAVGYEYAYVLIRVLNSLKPKRILECGLGQSSIIMNSYLSFYDDVIMDIVEQNMEWVDFFEKENVLDENVNIHIRNITKKRLFDYEINPGFSEHVTRIR